MASESGEQQPRRTLKRGRFSDTALADVLRTFTHEYAIGRKKGKPGYGLQADRGENGRLEVKFVPNRRRRG